MDLAAELARYGPEAPPAELSLSQARAYCRRLAREHYENFTVVSCLFSARLRPHLEAVYAWCRWADDLADETEDGPQALRLLDWWHGELLAAQASRHPVLIALRETLRQASLGLEPFLALLSAFRQDQTQTRYDTVEELLDYCNRSANPVGRIVLALAGGATPENCRLADRICTGLQLANFCQDVSRDLARGRIYLPRAVRTPLGWDDVRFAQQPLHADRAFCELLRGETERAEDFLRGGQALAARCPAELRRPVRTFLGGGLAICAAIRRQQHDVLARRPVVSRWRKLWLLLAG